LTPPDRGDRLHGLHTTTVRCLNRGVGRTLGVHVQRHPNGGSDVARHNRRARGGVRDYHCEIDAIDGYVRAQRNARSVQGGRQAVEGSAGRDAGVRQCVFTTRQ